MNIRIVIELYSAKFYNRKLNISATNKSEIKSFGTPVETRSHKSQGRYHPRTSLKRGPNKLLTINIPIATKADENVPLSTDSIRKLPISIYDTDQIKNEGIDIKRQLSFLKNDIIITPKNLKEIDVNISPTKMITENELGPNSPIEVPYTHFYKALGLATRKKDMEDFRSISTIKSNVSGLSPFRERYQQQIFSSPIQVPSVNYINKENSGEHTSFIKMEKTNFNLSSKKKIKHITPN